MWFLHREHCQAPCLTRSTKTICSTQCVSQGVDDHRRLHRPGGHPEDQPGARGGPPGLQEEDPEPQPPQGPPDQDSRVGHSRVLCREMPTHFVHSSLMFTFKRKIRIYIQATLLHVTVKLL